MTSTSALDLLVGEWRGRGVADYPTIERVEYTETLRVEWDAGHDVLAYEQRAWLSDGSPSHRESGFLRVAVSAERLEYELTMATNTTPRPEILPHLRCVLARTSGDR